MPKVAITDRGYRGVKQTEGVEILIPSRGKKVVRNIKNIKHENDLEQEQVLNRLSDILRTTTEY